MPVTKGLGIEIADSLVAALEAADVSWAASFTPVRVLAPQWKVEELTTLRVCVCPRARAFSRRDRANVQHEVTIEIGIQKREATEAACETLATLVDQLADWLAAQIPAGTFNIAELSQPVMFDPDHWRRHQVFTSVLAVKVVAY